MLDSIKKAFCLFQIGTGLIGFFTLLYFFPVYLSHLRGFLRSTGVIVNSQERLIVRSSDLLERTQKILGDVRNTAKNFETALPKLQASTQTVSENLKFWSDYTEKFIGICDAFSNVSKNTADFLPIKIPSGLKIDTEQLKIKSLEISYPSGVQPTYTLILAEEKETLETAAENWAEISQRFAETTYLFETGSGGLDQEIVRSLEAAQKSLALTSGQIEEMVVDTIPDFIHELELQQAELKSAEIVLSVFEAGLLPAAIFLICITLIWTVNGLILYSVIRPASVRSNNIAKTG